jgi:hypothetical protein
MGRVRHDGELYGCTHPPHRFLIEGNYLFVVSADDQQNGRPHDGQRVARQIGAPAAPDSP